MDFTFTKAQNGIALVLVDDVIIGGLLRREMAGRGYSKVIPSMRRVRSWTATVSDIPGLELDEDDRRSIEQHLTRLKTTRNTAADYLVSAYAAADVELPQPPEETE